MVLLSSHLMGEVALTADNLVVIGRGRILETTTVAAFAQVQYETRAIPGQVPVQYGEPAATYTQPNTQEVPR